MHRLCVLACLLIASTRFSGQLDVWCLPRPSVQMWTHGRRPSREQVERGQLPGGVDGNSPEVTPGVAYKMEPLGRLPAWAPRQRQRDPLVFMEQGALSSEIHKAGDVLWTS